MTTTRWTKSPSPSPREGFLPGIFASRYQRALACLDVICLCKYNCLANATVIKARDFLFAGKLDRLGTDVSSAAVILRRYSIGPHPKGSPTEKRARALSWTEPHLELGQGSASNSRISFSVSAYPPSPIRIWRMTPFLSMRYLAGQ